MMMQRSILLIFIFKLLVSCASKVDVEKDLNSQIMRKPSNKSCNNVIWYLPQVHMTGNMFSNISLANQESKNLKAIEMEFYNSQFKILKFFERRFKSGQRSFVFNEGESKEKHKSRHSAATVKTWIYNFNDLPDSFDEFPERDLFAFLAFDAPQIAFELSYIDSLYPCFRQSEENEYFRKYKSVTKDDWRMGLSQDKKDIVYRYREEEALKAIIHWFSENPKEREAILVFGSGHSFDKYQDIFPAQCIQTPDEFK